MLEGLPGFYSFGSQIDPLSYYQRSRLGRWIVDREVDPEDSVIGIELVTPAGPVRIRYEVTLAGQPFRAVREQMIDELMALAKEPVDKEKVVAEEAVEEEVVEEEVVEEEVVDNPPDPQPEKVAKEEAGDTDGVAKDKEEVAKEAADDAQEVASDKEDDAEENPREETEGDDPPEQAEEEVELTNAEVYTAATQNDRLAAYARSRGERLKKHELRRRAADVAGGPALLWTSPDVAADREETATLFAFLDADEDGVISSRERSTAVETLEDQDVNADGRIARFRSPKKKVNQTWRLTITGWSSLGVSTKPRFIRVRRSNLLARQCYFRIPRLRLL